MTGRRLDAIVVGAGPNGLAAAIELARAGRSVRVYEAAVQVGGGTRSAALTLPGFVHDPCASVHPLSLASPFIRSLELARHGLEWVQPDAPVAHALAPGRSVVLERDIGALDDALGRDAEAWRRVFGPFVREWDRLMPALLGPVVRPPRHPLLLARFGLPAMFPATSLARLAFREAPPARCSPGWPRTPCSGWGSRSARRSGWCSACSPTPSGGPSPAVAAAPSPPRSRRRRAVWASSSRPATAWTPSPRCRRPGRVLLDVTPRQVLAIAGDRLPAGYRRQLERFRYGPGVFKVDWALDGRSRGATRPRHALGPSTSGARSRRSPRPKTPWGAAGTPRRRSSCSSSRRIADPTRAPAGQACRVGVLPRPQRIDRST